jgi:hypothetical protein
MPLLDRFRFRSKNLRGLNLLEVVPLENRAAVKFILDARRTHLELLFASTERVCATNQKIRTLSNLFEKLDAFNNSLDALDRLRHRLPKHHKPVFGIRPDGQQRIYEATCVFFDSYYSYMNVLKGFVSEFQKTFPRVQHATVDGFLNWVSSEFPNPIAYRYSLKPARDFRSTLVHPLANSPVHWETATNYASEVYVITKGLKDRGHDVGTLNVTYPEGVGWLIPAPSESHVVLFTIDLTSWILSTVLEYQVNPHCSTRKDWAQFKAPNKSATWVQPDWAEIVLSRSFASEEQLRQFTSNPVFG